MKKRMFTAFILLLFGALLFAQSPVDSISRKPLKWGGYEYYQYEKKVNFGKLPNAMISNPSAYTQMRKAKSNMGFAIFLGGLGGAMMGTVFVQNIFGREVNWRTFGIGAGVALLGLPVERVSHKQTKAAIATFNSDFGAPTPSVGYRLDFGFQQNGLGLALRF